MSFLVYLSEFFDVKIANRLRKERRNVMDSVGKMELEVTENRRMGNCLKPFQGCESKEREGTIGSG